MITTAVVALGRNEVLEINTPSGKRYVALVEYLRILFWSIWFNKHFEAHSISSLYSETVEPECF